LTSTFADTLTEITKDFNRRLIHMEEHGSSKAKEIEVQVVNNTRCIERLTQLYEKGVLVVIILSFFSGANSLINILEYIKGAFLR